MKRAPLFAAVAVWAAGVAVAAAGFVLALTLPPGVPVAARQPQQVVLLAVMLTTASVGAFLVERLPRNPIGWLLCAAAVTFGSAGLLYFAVLHYAFSGGAPALLLILAASIGNLAWPLGIGLVAAYVPLYFPDGHLPSPRWRILSWAIGLAVAVNAASNAVSPDALDTAGRHIPNPIGIVSVAPLAHVLLAVTGLVMVTGLVASAASVVVRYRRGSDQLRHQLKWFVAAVAFMVASLLLSFALAESVVAGSLMAISMALLPAAIAVAVLRYRLYDIDIVINKALVYGSLGVLIAAVYVAVVAGVGALVGSGRSPNIVLSIIATAIVAIAFQPVRTRLQRLANRLVYGKRATPYEVMAEFSHRMADAISVEEVLPRIAEAAGRGVNGVYARVLLQLPGGGVREATWPASAASEPSPATQFRLAVSDQGTVTGEIGVSKGAGDSLAPGERRLLEHLAGQAGLVFSNLSLTLALQDRLEELKRLAAELEDSRHRIVTAADAERRRLESQLREGTDRELAELERDLERAHQVLPADPAAAAALLQELTDRAGRLLDALRELARGIFPPLLADRGFAAALEAHARRLPEVTVRVEPELARVRFDSKFEAALYFVCTTALSRTERSDIEVIRRSAEVTCRIHGFDPARIVDIRDRVEAVGGTLKVATSELVASFPAPALELVG